MTRKEALAHAAARIGAREAGILLCHHLGIDRVRLINEEQRPMEREEEYFALVARIERHEPIEYITGLVSFYGETFHIAPGALIPRPETELLLEEVATLIRQRSDTPSIAEIGTGSGILSVMLAKLFPKLHIVATDISEDALNIAEINARRFEVAERITFVKTHLLDGINEDFAIILSNPPYIAREFKIDPKLTYEPAEALFGGVMGDELLKEIIDLAAMRNAEYLACEMGYDQRGRIDTYIARRGYGSCRFYRDLAGLDRGFVLKIEETKR